MDNYQHILFATDFSEHSQQVANRAKDIALLHNAKLSVVHIVEDLPMTDAAYGPVIPFDVDLMDEIMKIAKDKLLKVAQSLDIDEAGQYLDFGSPKLEIVRIAEENAVDLLVFGSHGRHGFALLLGSTANSIMHHAPCDILAVRLKNN